MSGGYDPSRYSWRTCCPWGLSAGSWHDAWMVPIVTCFPASERLLVLVLEDDDLQVHVLDAGPGVENRLRALEQRTAALFGVRLRATGEAGP